MDEIIEKNALMQERYLSGLYDGIEKNKEEIVLKMYKENMEISLISKIVNLSIKEINEIIKQDK